MSEQPVPTTLSVSEVRSILQIGLNSAYNLIHSKSFPVKRIGHTYRIPAEPFFKWLGNAPVILPQKADK